MVVSLGTVEGKPYPSAGSLTRSRRGNPAHRLSGRISSAFSRASISGVIGAISLAPRPAGAPSGRPGLEHIVVEEAVPGLALIGRQVASVSMACHRVNIGVTM
jgi:hypothetical protein